MNITERSSVTWIALNQGRLRGVSNAVYKEFGNFSQLTRLCPDFVVLYVDSIVEWSLLWLSIFSSW